jgi:predicted HAD superfamily Cof-like phosphohydrolase
LSNFQRTAQWLERCGKVRSNRLHLSVQLGCHLEEVVELLETLEFNEHFYNRTLEMVKIDLGYLGKLLKNNVAEARVKPQQREQLLDAICDSEVTGNGVAYLAGFDKDGADGAVLDANDAKLVDGKPVLLPGGKIGKPEGWRPPDLSLFI